ncbi:hypothetical protein N7528_006847 [Penicillium herquei]|nr:hypothetical protein N7528_006847 [Penicillium herquei]
MAAPEGDYFFHHNALKSANFNPTNEKQFYNTIWLEVATGKSIDEGMQDAPPIPWELHPRAGLQNLPGGALTTTYDRYKYMTAMVGSSNRKISRYKKVEGTTSRADLEHQSGKKTVHFVPVDMPTSAEGYLWVDLTYPLRGIYFPKRAIAQPRYKDWCVYSRINFTALQELTLKTFANPRPPPPGRWEKMKMAEKIEGPPFKVRRLVEEQTKIPPATFPEEKLKEGSLTIKPDEWLGWDVRVEWTVRFDVKHIMHILSLPRDWLKDEYLDPYKFMELYDCRYLDLVGTESYGMDSHGVDLMKVIRKEYGISVRYDDAGFDPNWVVKAIGGIALVGVSLIPGYGPLIAFGGQMLLDVFTDPDVFTATKFTSDRAPVVAAAGYAQLDEVKKLVASSTKEAKNTYLNERTLKLLGRLAKGLHK